MTPLRPIEFEILLTKAIVAIVLMATWVPARRELDISPRDAIGRD